MTKTGAAKQATERDGVSRRDFLRVGGLSVVGLSVGEQPVLQETETTAQRSCLFILMTGGPGPLETFDPKPQAPAEFRGPLKPISTRVPGTAFSESLPRLAQRTDKLAVLRSLTHDAAPLHETGLQLLQTGRTVRGGRRFPSFGSVVGRVLGPRDGIVPYAVLPRFLSHIGVDADRGQGAGELGAAYDPVVPETDPSDREAMPRSAEPDLLRRAYGETRFGRLLLQARELIECGVRCVTVNLFDSLSGQITWDCHGRGPESPATLYDYRDILGPQFDQALAALLDDLEQRGLLQETLVVAAGEFGRTPRVNKHGGRDHWPGVWSALMAGGGVQGGRVIGASDSRGTAPAERPIAPGELTASIYHGLGLDLKLTLQGVDGVEFPLTEHPPIAELFA